MQKVSSLVSKDISNYLTNRASWNIFYNAKSEGMAGDGTTDDYADLSTLINTTINGAEATIIFSPGTYKIGTNITIPSNVTLFLTKGAMLSPDSGKTITINGPVEAGIWKIFTGSGTITGSPKVDRFYPQWWGAKADGITADQVPMQAALDACTAAGGGVVYAPTGTYFISGENFINVKPNVILRGSGPSTRFVSGSGGKTANHIFVYLKDNAAVEDCHVSGSDYVKQSGGADGIGYNKIGVGTQGAAIGKGFRVSRVGFEKCLNSHVYVHDAHSDALIEDCYTFGTQVGVYADVDSNNLVTNWNATKDNAKLTAGTQVYCLTNFYNSGSATPTTDVLITGGRHVNINDAFAGISNNSKRHTFVGNISVKNATGYYGGYGIDINGGDEVVASGNMLEGYTVGCHLLSSVNCSVSGNLFKCDIGVWIENVASIKNTITGNTVRLTENNATIANKMGVQVTAAQNNTISGNTIDGNSIAASRGVYFESSAIGNNVASNIIANTITGIESAASGSDSNYAYVNVFRSVTTKFPRAIFSNFFQDVRGISGTSSNANNLGGSVTVSDTNTSQAVTFTNAEPDSSFRIMLTVRSVSGAPAAGAYTPAAPSSKATTGFTVNLQAAPGAGTSITYEWFLFRA